MEDYTEEKPFKDDVNLQENGNKVQNDRDGETKTTRNRREFDAVKALRVWKIIAVVLAIVCIILLISVISVAIVKDKQIEEGSVPPCEQQESIDLSEPSGPSVFSDLTTEEVKGLTDFIYSNADLDLVRPDQIKVSKNYMYLAELYIPNKTDAVAYLDGDTIHKPKREAKVVLFKGNKTPPEIQEIVVTPLPNPTHYRVLREKIPFIYRPLTGPEISDIMILLRKEAHEVLGDMLLESYGGRLTEDCGSRCLVFNFISPVSTGLSGTPDKRKIWFWLSQFAEFYMLHPMDFAVLVEMDGPNYTIEDVWYNGHRADSFQTLKQQYNGGQIDKRVIPFPDDDNTLFSKMAKRGESFPKNKQRPPMQVEPDGKRYNIQGRHVTYMNWQFDFRMSSSQGPQVYDIRYQNKRIAFEHGLQEICVFYSGYKPAQMFANYFDSVALIGPQGKGMVPGVDCPAHATFIPASHLLEGSDKLMTFNNVFCIFEQDPGMPLRRHHSFYPNHGAFYEGMPGHVLILRTMITVINYDYIFDFVFYQNGVMETKVLSTGYIVATAFTEKERPFGAQVHDFISGNLHHHLFNFKSDLDINGVKNRYDTLDITTTEVPNQFNPDPNAKHTQPRFDRTGKTTEQEAAYKFNFETPKYHIFYNNLVNNKFGNPKSYRVMLKGMSKQILPEGSGVEPSASWMRYQMAVTKHKEDERCSSSLYSCFDAKKPVVNFQSFVDDNESLVDEVIIT